MKEQWQLCEGSSHRECATSTLVGPVSEDDIYEDDDTDDDNDDGSVPH